MTSDEKRALFLRTLQYCADLTHNEGGAAVISLAVDAAQGERHYSKELDAAFAYVTAGDDEPGDDEPQPEPEPIRPAIEVAAEELIFFHDTYHNVTSREAVATALHKATERMRRVISDSGDVDDPIGVAKLIVEAINSRKKFVKPADALNPGDVVEVAGEAGVYGHVMFVSFAEDGSVGYVVNAGPGGYRFAFHHRDMRAFVPRAKP